jgi:hypothetical protein
MICELWALCICTRPFLIVVCFFINVAAVNAGIQEFVEIWKQRALMDASSEYGILQFMDAHLLQ